jgi:hypothetical protein
VNVYLLLIDDERFFFYSAENEVEDADVVDGPGGPAASDETWRSRLAGRLAGRLERFKNDWRHAQTGLLGKVHRCWDWLHTFIHPQESMLVRLYWIKRIDLYYPASKSAVVRTIWQGYLRGRFWHHLIWLVINALIVPFVAVLAILPGPNVIGFWFTYRAIHHALIVLGIRRARREQVPTSLIASEALDRPVQRDAKGKAAHPIFRGARNHHRLHVYYEWAGGLRHRFRSAHPDGSKPSSIDTGDGFDSL